MLSPIMPYIPSSNEGIPHLDIFAHCGDVKLEHQTNSWPSPTVKSASLLVNELDQATFDAQSDVDFLKVKNMRKSTACETELDLSVEISNDAPKTTKRKQSLLAGVEPTTNKFEQIFGEEETIEANTVHFLGKRSCLQDSNDSLEFTHLAKNKSYPCYDSIFSMNQDDALKLKDSKKMCPLGHRIGQASSGADDCYLCRSVLSNIQRYANEKGGRLVSTVLTFEVTMSCENNHEWNICYKKATKSWCKDCKQKRKQLLKEMLEEENSKINEERKQKQARLLEEARKRIQNNDESKKQENKAELDNFSIVLEEITRIASKYAREYCQKDESAEFEQILLLYQTLILPEKCLITYFNSLTKEELRREFRRYTILLHPDKNSHPKAKQAFQKAYDLISSRVDPINA